MQSTSKASSLVIYGVGAVTPLGLDADNAFAAARAGFSRATPSDMFSVRDPDSGEGQGVVAHEVPMVTYGFEGLGRLQQLITAGLVDLKRNVSPQYFEGDPVCFYIALPSLKRVFTGGALLGDEEMHKDWDEQQKNQPEFNDALVSSLLMKGLDAAGLTGQVKLAGFDVSGHAAGGALIEQAWQDIHKGDVTKAVLGGIDTYLGFHTINWLDYTQRLKNDDNPEAMQPSEGAVFVALAPEQGGPSGCVAVKSVATGMETDSLLSGERSIGRTFTQTILRASTPQLETASQFTSPWLITDHNGEFYRANEWGNVITQIKSKRPELETPETWFPAINFGDTGAAFVPLAIAQAYVAFQRGYSEGEHAIVCASSDNGLRAAICVGV